MSNKEEVLFTGKSTKDERKFDTIIGVLEDAVIEDYFMDMQENFLEKYYMEFEDVDENKFVYSDIFREYINMVESYIERKLLERIPGFKMPDFLKTLASRQNQMDEGIFEMLLTFTDFLAFKQLVLDYRKAKEGVTPNLSCGLLVTSARTVPPDESHSSNPFLEFDEKDRTSLEVPMS